jgi:hypothetical protein
MSYPTGTVYKIICYLDSDIIYIGSTFNSLRNRWQEHKYDFRKYLDGKKSCVSIYPYFEKYGIENFKIIKIKEYKCYRENRSDRRHMNVYENLWINKTKNCVNKQNPFCIQKLSDKFRYQNNKEQISGQRKEYYENNKEKISQRAKIYRKNNKEKIRERKLRPTFCIICKNNTTHDNFKRHTRTPKHIQNAQQCIYNFILKSLNKNI